jgi:hypothetical protein
LEIKQKRTLESYKKHKPNGLCFFVILKSKKKLRFPINFTLKKQRFPIFAVL